VNADGVRLTDGTALQPDAIVAATGYTTGLEPIVGHLGVLDEHGMPFHYRGPAVRPGLRFLGYAPCMGVIGRDARRVIRHLYRELTSPEATATSPEATATSPEAPAASHGPASHQPAASPAAAASIPEPAVSPEAARPATRP
jgi:hypothetical protein